MRIEREKLAEKLSILGQAFEPKNPVPSLTCLKWNNNELTMSNSNQTIITNIEFEFIEDTETEFKALIPFKMFSDIVNKLKTDYIYLEIKNNLLQITSNRSLFKLNLVDYNTYPYITKYDHEKALKIDSKLFKDILAKTSYSCATNDKRPILKGIHFKNKYNKVVCIATNSFVLSQYTIDQDIDLDMTIDKQDLERLCKILPKEDTLIEMQHSNNNATFIFNDVIFQTRLLDGVYPETSKLIPNEFGALVYVNRDELKNALDRMSIFQSQDDLKSLIIKMRVSEEELSLQSLGSQLGAGLEIVNCKSNAESFEIGFDGMNVIKALETFDNENVVIGFNGAIKPFILTEKEDISNIQLVLPVRVD